jgi:hypothetical protein
MKLFLPETIFSKLKKFLKRNEKLTNYFRICVPEIKPSLKKYIN